MSSEVSNGGIWSYNPSTKHIAQAGWLEAVLGSCSAPSRLNPCGISRGPTVGRWWFWSRVKTPMFYKYTPDLGRIGNPFPDVSSVAELISISCPENWIGITPDLATWDGFDMFWPLVSTQEQSVGQMNTRRLCQMFRILWSLKIDSPKTKWSMTYCTFFQMKHVMTWNDYWSFMEFRYVLLLYVLFHNCLTTLWLWQQMRSVWRGESWSFAIKTWTVITSQANETTVIFFLGDAFTFFKCNITF